MDRHEPDPVPERRRRDGHDRTDRNSGRTNPVSSLRCGGLDQAAPRQTRAARQDRRHQQPHPLPGRPRGIRLPREDLPGLHGDLRRQGEPRDHRSGASAFRLPPAQSDLRPRGIPTVPGPRHRKRPPDPVPPGVRPHADHPRHRHIHDALLRAPWLRFQRQLPGATHRSV